MVLPEQNLRRPRDRNESRGWNDSVSVPGRWLHDKFHLVQDGDASMEQHSSIKRGCDNEEAVNSRRLESHSSTTEDQNMEPVYASKAAEFRDRLKRERRERRFDYDMNYGDVNPLDEEISGLDPDHARRIRDVYARDYCSYCGSKTHQQFDCPERPVCRVCGSLNHYEYQCLEPVQRQYRPRNPRSRSFGSPRRAETLEVESRSLSLRSTSPSTSPPRKRVRSEVRIRSVNSTTSTNMSRKQMRPREGTLASIPSSNQALAPTELGSIETNPTTPSLSKVIRSVEASSVAAMDRNETQSTETETFTATLPILTRATQLDFGAIGREVGLRWREEVIEKKEPAIKDRETALEKRETEVEKRELRVRIRELEVQQRERELAAKAKELVVIKDEN